MASLDGGGGGGGSLGENTAATNSFNISLCASACYAVRSASKCSIACATKSAVVDLLKTAPRAAALSKLQPKSCVSMDMVRSVAVSACSSCNLASASCFWQSSNAFSMLVLIRSSKAMFSALRVSRYTLISFSATSSPANATSLFLRSSLLFISTTFGAGIIFLLLFLLMFAYCLRQS